MSFQVLSNGGLLTEKTILTDNTATDVLDLGKAVLVESITCVEVGGNTPNLTVESYDGTTSYYRRNAKAMTAKEEVTIPGWRLDNNEVLRVTSSHASGLVHVFVNYFNPDATQRAS